MQFHFQASVLLVAIQAQNLSSPPSAKGQTPAYPHLFYISHFIHVLLFLDHFYPFINIPMLRVHLFIFKFSMVMIYPDDKSG